MKLNNWDTIWFKEIWEKGYTIARQQSNRLRENKEMLVNKWANFYFRKFRKGKKI